MTHCQDHVTTQVTTYVYGTTLSDSAVARADLLRAAIYPDSDDTVGYVGPVPVLDNGSSAPAGKSDLSV